MKPFQLFNLFVVLFLLANAHPLWAQSRPQPFAVVELFTSEGCSSCPPADALLSRLSAAARQQGLRVYPLSFHVDYWNYLGWRDLYSAGDYTSRQRQYSRVLKSEAYTPQVVVNGQDAFVGSDAVKLKKEVDTALNQKAFTNIDITSLKTDGQSVFVDYHIGTLTPGDVLNVALVERGLQSDVVRGENAGRTLKHDNVVRLFRSQVLKDAKGQVSVPVSAVTDIKQSSVVLYVQNAMTMLIEAAIGIDLSM